MPSPFPCYQAVLFLITTDLSLTLIRLVYSPHNPTTITPKTAGFSYSFMWSVFHQHAAYLLLFSSSELTYPKFLPNSTSSIRSFLIITKIIFLLKIPKICFSNIHLIYYLIEYHLLCPRTYQLLTILPDF